MRYVNGIASDRQNTHTLPSYTLVDMTVGYDLSKVGLTGVSAQLNVNNLTDRSYVAACNSLLLLLRCRTQHCGQRFVEVLSC